MLPQLGRLQKQLDDATLARDKGQLRIVELERKCSKVEDDLKLKVLEKEVAEVREYVANYLVFEFQCFTQFIGY